MRSGERRTPLSRTADVLATGYLLSRDLHRTLFPGCPGERKAAEICALLNLLMMSVDAIVDDYPRHTTLLVERLDPVVLPLLTDEAGSTAAEDSGERSEPLAVRLAVGVGRSFVGRCRRLLRESGDAGSCAALRNALRASYEAEMESAATTFRGVRDPDRVRETLRGKSALPFWIFGCIAAVAAGRPLKGAGPDELLRLVGDLLWIVDDVADVELDVLNGLWNYVPLRVVERGEREYGRILAGLPPRDRVARLVADGAVDEAVDELRAAYRTVLRALEERPGAPGPLGAHLSGWLHLHVAGPRLRGAGIG